jgi:hypothetical protein
MEIKARAAANRFNADLETTHCCRTTKSQAKADISSFGPGLATLVFLLHTFTARGPRR